VGVAGTRARVVGSLHDCGSTRQAATLERPSHLTNSQPTNHPAPQAHLLDSSTLESKLKFNFSTCGPSDAARAALAARQDPDRQLYRWARTCMGYQ
jgi:hypothetical protein